MIPVTGSLIQIDGTDTWCIDMFVSEFLFLFIDVVFQLFADDRTIWKPHRHSGTDQDMIHEQFLFLADLSVVSLLGFFNLLQTGIQFFL